MNNKYCYNLVNANIIEKLSGKSELGFFFFYYLTFKTYNFIDSVFSYF